MLSNRPGEKLKGNLLVWDLPHIFVRMKLRALSRGFDRKDARQGIFSFCHISCQQAADKIGVDSKYTDFFC